MAQPFLMSQQFPCSVGGRLLDAGHLTALKESDAWDSFRLSLGAAQLLKRRPCVLCSGLEAGHAHTLAACSVLCQDRAMFLANVDAGFAARMASAPPGDWPSVLLSPHLELDRLKVVVSFCARIMEALKTKEASTKWSVHVHAIILLSGIALSGATTVVGAKRRADPFRGPALQA